MSKEEKRKLPEFKNGREIYAYVSRLQLAATVQGYHGLLPDGTKIEFLEYPESPFSGILLANINLKGHEKFSLVLGIVDKHGTPWLAFSSQPIGSGHFHKRKEIAKETGTTEF